MPPTAYVRPVETGVDLDLAALRRVLGSLALRQRRGAESRALLAAVVERRRLT